MIYPEDEAFMTRLFGTRIADPRDVLPKLATHRHMRIALRPESAMPEAIKAAVDQIAASYKYKGSDGEVVIGWFLRRADPMHYDLGTLILKKDEDEASAPQPRADAEAVAA